MIPVLAVIAAVATLAVPTGLTVGLAAATGADAALGQVPCGPGGPAAQVGGTSLDIEQAANARTIITTVAARGLPQRAAVIAVSTAMTESGLRNLPYGDRDSLGLFQQRPSWGPAQARLNPVTSTGLFLDRLVAVPSWESLPITAAADKVQHSAFPDRVTQWESLALALVAKSGADWSRSAPIGEPADSGVPGLVAACPGEGGDAAADTDARPGELAAAGLTTVTGIRALVVGFAVKQLGKPYIWGATGPNSYDCSGLTQQAWAAAGVPIPRTTYAQVAIGDPVTQMGQLQPGDLLFTAGSDGTPSNPGHVGLYIGPVNGTPALIQAPHTGAVVEITPLAEWSSQIVAMRRPGF